MNTNCLVTKLKSIVYNDSLDVLGEVKIYIETTGNSDPSITIETTKNVEIECTDTLQLNNETSLIITPFTPFSLNVSGSGYVKIKDKYHVKRLYTYNILSRVDLSNLNHMQDLEILIMANNEPYGDITKLLNDSSISHLEIGGSLVHGDLNKVDSQKLKNIETFNIVGPKDIIGNTILFENGKLVNFTFNNCSNIVGDISFIPNKGKGIRVEFYNSGITGSIEEYVDSAIQDGKTIATDFRMVGAITQLTFNGIKQPTNNIRFEAPCYVSWDTTGKISIKTGDYSVENTTHVFCKGYTQSEAEEAFPDKTIIRVDA